MKYSNIYYWTQVYSFFASFYKETKTYLDPLVNMFRATLKTLLWENMHFINHKKYLQVFQPTEY